MAKTLRNRLKFDLRWNEGYYGTDFHAGTKYSSHFGRNEMESITMVPSYTSYQDSRLALNIGSPLLSYIDVHLPRFLLKGLIMGEAREKGPCRRIESSLDLVKDGLGDAVFQGRAEHIPIEKPTILALDAIMVQQHNMNIRRYFSDAQPVGGQATP